MQQHGHNQAVCNYISFITHHRRLQVIDVIAKERSLKRPSVSYGAENLYMHGPLEELTKQNLSKVGLLYMARTVAK